MDIIERARRCVATRPPAIEGQGGNATTFGVAAMLVWGFGLSPDEALPLMMDYNSTCEPPWETRELSRMLASALQRSHEKPRGYMVGDGAQERSDDGNAAIEPEPDRKRRKKFDIADLERAQDPALKMEMSEWRRWLRSRSTIEPRGLTAEAYLDHLYRPGEKILIFNKMWGTQGDFCRVAGKQTWRLGRFPDEKATVSTLPEGSDEGMTFLMQPVDTKWRVKRGDVKMSRRTADSVVRWPFVLLENDKAPHEMWLNALVRARIRIVSITASGGRSLHAMVRLDKENEAELLRELQHKDAAETLTVLGCDPQALHGMVYPRLPNTWRGGKRMTKLDAQGQKMRDPKTNRPIMHFVPNRYGRAMQTLLYFNPSPDKGRSIAEGLIFEREE